MQQLSVLRCIPFSYCTPDQEMVITSSRLANGTHIFSPPSLIAKWRTRVARTQLEFAARDHEFTSSVERSITLLSELAYVTTHFDLPSSPHFVADFLQAILHGNRPFCGFELPLGARLGETYDVHLRLIGKRVEDFVLVD